MGRRSIDILSLGSLPQTAVRVAALAVAMIGILLCRSAQAVPSFARQTDMPCAQCHTLSFGPALTEYGREFKLNGYSWGQGDSPMPVALMIQGGFSHSDAPQPDPPAPHYSRNNNISVDQISLFYGGRLTEHSGAFVQATYSGPDRNTSWDNMDVRYARAIELAGTEAVVGLSLNNNPTVQDLWNSTPAWGFPYITSPLVPGASAATLIEGGLAQTVLGVTAYTMIHNHVYLEGGVYRNLTDKWLGNVGVSPDSNPHIKGVAPYWRLAYQNNKDPHYFSVGAFGLTAHLQPDPTVPDQNRYTDIGFDAVYQYTDGGRQSLTVNTSYIHENQNLTAIFNAGGADHADNHLNTFRIDASYAYHQTWSAGVGFFDITGATDLTLYAPGALSGSNNGSPDTRGYVLQFECVPLGKMASWGRPWVNFRVGLQYTGYFKFNGGASNYDGFGRSATQNNSLFLFSWMAF
jgi:hypothetical protein